MCLESKQAEVDRLRDRLLGAKNDLFNEQKRIIGLAGYEFNELVIGTWSCPDSPIDICFYDVAEDFCMDECLACGHPDERK